MKILNRSDTLSAESEDDSSFVSMADFLSLISLSFIYMAIVFGTPMAASDSVEVVQAERAKAGPAIPRDNNKAYVSLLPIGNGVLLIRVVPPHGAPPQEKRVLLSAGDSRPTVEWVASTLAKGSAPHEVILFLWGDEWRKEVERNEASWLFLEISRRLVPMYHVRHVS